MDWQALHSGYPRDQDMPARAFKLSSLTAVLEGRQYDHIACPFSEEISPAGEYVPLSHRRPSVRTGLCRTVVDDSVSLLFSEGHFPAIRSDDQATNDALASLAKVCRLNELLVDAATRGSVGSVAILFRVLRGKPFFSVLSTDTLTPAHDPMDPDALVSVTERYKVSAADLIAQGYSVDSRAGMHWFQRVWNADAETWFLPWPVSTKDAVPSVDTSRTVVHGLGFVPVVWIRNLPGGDDIDGACTFDAAISTVIEIDYALSQAGRGLKYASDPRLVIRDSNGGNAPLTGGASNAIVLSDPTAEAKFLEINGSAADAVREYVSFLRGIALESVHGMRADADKLSAASSGRALEMLHQGLIWLGDRLRTSYGEGALLSLLGMVCRASCVVRGGLIINGKAVVGLQADGLSLVWPRWFEPTAEDRQADAITAKTLADAGVLSRETALRNVAKDYDVDDVAAELALIEKETLAADARAIAMTATVKTADSMTA